MIPEHPKNFFIKEIFLTYKIYRILDFKKEQTKLSLKDNERILKIIEQLKDNPYVGDQLQIKSLRKKIR